jgi:hypothetical protein
MAHVLIGEPVSTPDQVRGKLSPERALVAALCAPAPRADKARSVTLWSWFETPRYARLLTMRAPNLR